jgi:hypothetical protein
VRLATHTLLLLCVSFIYLDGGMEYAIYNNIFLYILSIFARVGRCIYIDSNSTRQN